MPVKLRPHKLQSKLYRTRARFPVVWAGRGSGKTEVMKRKIVRALSMHYPKPIAAGDVPRFFYGLPTNMQAKRVAWDSLKAMLPLAWYERKGRTFYESDRVIRTRFGTELHVVGLDAPQRIEGNQWSGGVLDECSDQRPKVFDLTVRPALTAYGGWCARIGVPKRFGIGAEHFKLACDQALAGVDPEMEAYHWLSETVVTAEELEAIKATLDERDFNEQYRATWEQIAGAVFWAFDEAVNIDVTAAVYNPQQQIVVGSDFNVDPMCWVLAHREPNCLRVFDELCLRNTNTQETLNVLYRKYGMHEGGWEFFGDASSKARKTSASSSDYIQIYNDDRFVNKQVYYYDSNPSVIDRFAACNAMLRNARGEHRLFINPRCERLIADLKHRSFKPGSKDVADSGDMGHMSDGLGYIIVRVFPLKVEIDTPPGEITVRTE